MERSSLQSFTAANALPMKVLIDEDVLNKIVKERKIPPVHLQLYPTTRCQMKCEFCSCRNMPKDTDIPWKEMKEIMFRFRIEGAKSVTISGGGEPALYPWINELICLCEDLEIEMGLVSNAYSLDLIEDMRKFTWARISVSDVYGFASKLRSQLEIAYRKAPNVDWAFSYVITENVKFGEVANMIRFANEHEFTHIRLVSDLLNLGKVPGMEMIKGELEKIGVNDELVIYQGRKEFTRGEKKCYISLLKPVIASDGYLYPCCGMQYAEKSPAMGYSENMRMGKAIDVTKIWRKRKYFNGSICVRCYYAEYNWLLGSLLSELKHAKFV